MDDAMVIHAEYVHALFPAPNEHLWEPCDFSSYQYASLCRCVLELLRVTSSWSEMNALILLWIIIPQFIRILSALVEHC
jgi:hypothetical protein